MELLFLLCYASLHYAIGKVNVYLPSAVGMAVWYWSDISFKRCLSLHLKIPLLGFFLNEKKEKIALNSKIVSEYNLFADPLSNGDAISP